MNMVKITNRCVFHLGARQEDPDTEPGLLRFKCIFCGIEWFAKSRFTRSSRRIYIPR